MNVTDFRARVGLVVLGIALLLLIVGLPIVWGSAVGVVAAIVGDTTQASGGWLLGVMGVITIAVVVGIGGFLFGAWRHDEQRDPAARRR